MMIVNKRSFVACARRASSPPFVRQAYQITYGVFSTNGASGTSCEFNASTPGASMTTKLGLVGFS